MTPAAPAPDATPRTDALIAELDKCHETQIAFVLRQFASHARILERENAGLAAKWSAAYDRCNELIAACEKAESALAASAQREQRATETLRWALDELGEYDEETERMPEHHCDFIDAPDKGRCEFHERYWDARALLVEPQQKGEA